MARKNTKAEQARIDATNAERDKLIALLGMAPEDRSSADTRYAATPGELWTWARQDGHDV